MMFVLFVLVKLVIKEVLIKLNRLYACNLEVACLLKVKFHT